MRLRARARLEFNAHDFKHTLGPAMAPALVLMGLIILQPDLGTALEIFLIALAILYVTGLSWRWLAVAGATALPIIFLLIVRVSYRYDRILGFLNPGADPQGRGFQLLQSLSAVGSGGFTGVGLMESKQKLFYLPEAHTDFIYAVLCEELGLIGGVIVLGLFAVYGWRGLRAAFETHDVFGRLLALGITAMVMSQALINLGVVLGMMPTKGIPLPFVSYGGSSLLVMLLATGVLLNISQQATEPAWGSNLPVGAPHSLGFAQDKAAPLLGWSVGHEAFNRRRRHGGPRFPSAGHCARMDVARKRTRRRVSGNATRNRNEAGAPGRAASGDTARRRPQGQTRHNANQESRHAWARPRRCAARTPQAQAGRCIWRWRLCCRPDDAGDLDARSAQRDLRA